ncbi:MAG: anti-sigma factor [Candidatus Auribacterota bacterium]|jgi:hypothetical protein|nr:anti-sigma factor [Candidatus Auribacterota bacterium]
MKCSDFSYYISEYIDNRLDMAMKKKVEAHLEICKDCKKEYNDLKELRALFTIKSYERPSPEYFENLKSVIKRRIIAQDVVSLRERIIKFVSQPSWAMTAAMVTALAASLSYNYSLYVQNQQLRSGRVIAQTFSQPTAQTSTMGFAFTPAKQSYMPIGQNNTAQGTLYQQKPYLVNTATNSAQPQRNFILTTIKARDVDSSNQARIFQ